MKLATHVDDNGTHWKFRTHCSKVHIEDNFEIHQEKVIFKDFTPFWNNERKYLFSKIMKI